MKYDYSDIDVPEFMKSGRETNKNGVNKGKSIFLRGLCWVLKFIACVGVLGAMFTVLALIETW